MIVSFRETEQSYNMDHLRAFLLQRFTFTAKRNKLKQLFDFFIHLTKV